MKTTKEEEKEMKKLICLICMLLLLASAALCAAEESYSFLEGMSLEELTALQGVLEAKIAQEKKATEKENPTDTGMWEIAYYVDEFRMPTDEKYIRNTSMIEGTFSNSATTNSELLVRFLIDKNDLSIMLYEYGRNQVKNSYSKTRYYDVAMLDANGTRSNLTGYIYSDSDRIFFSSEEEQKVINALKANGEVRFSIIESDRRTTSYLFTIKNTSYFSNAYRMLYE